MKKTKIIRKEVYRSGVQTDLDSIKNAISQERVTIEVKESCIYEDGTQTLTIKIIQNP